MAKITYNDLDGTSPTVTVHGHALESGDSFETDNEGIIERLSKNPWFDVSGEKPSAEVKEARKEIEANPLSDVELADLRQRGADAYLQGKKRTDVPPVYRGKPRGQAWQEGYDAEKAKDEADGSDEG